jgi:hypothetical protein
MFKQEVIIQSLVFENQLEQPWWNWWKSAIRNSIQYSAERYSIRFEFDFMIGLCDIQVREYSIRGQKKSIQFEFGFENMVPR